MEMINPTEKLELLAASASEIHAASERGKLRVEFKSDEDRTRKRQLRLLKNRQSAALSRQRKKEYINDLELRTNGLITENHDMLQKITKLTSMNLEYKMHIDALEKRLGEAKSENTELRTRLTAGAATSSSATSSASAPASTSSASVGATSSASVGATSSASVGATSSEARSTSSDSSSPTPMEEDSHQPPQQSPQQSQPSQQLQQQRTTPQQQSPQSPQQSQQPPYHPTTTTTTTTTITTTTTSTHPPTTPNP